MGQHYVLKNLATKQKFLLNYYFLQKEPQPHTHTKHKDSNVYERF